MQNNRKKLNLEQGKPTLIEMLFDQPLTGSSRYGDYQLYCIKNGDGTEYNFFCPEELHEKLKDLKKGDKVIVTKNGIQKGKRIVYDYEVTPIQSEDNSTIISENNDDYYLHAMEKSLEYSQLLQSKYSGLQLSQIAISIFIQMTKSRVVNN